MWCLWVELAIAEPTHAAMDGASWQTLAHAESADAGPVDVYTARISGVDCFRGVATTSVAADDLLAVILDMDSAARWSTTGVSESRLIARTPTSIVYYQYLDLPGWTLSADRYWFLEASIARSPGRQEVAWGPLPAASPHQAERARFVAEHPDAVEPPTNVGSWRFETVPAGTRVTYSVCTQSGGSIPVALQNAASRRSLPDNLGDLIREARRR